MEEQFTGDEEWHGTNSGYSYRGCRCEPCRLAQKAHRRAYYLANKEATLAQSKAWKEANPERRKATNAAWGRANRERRNETLKAWREANRERHLANQRARQNNPRRKAQIAEWHAKNRDKKREAIYAWREANREEFLAQARLHAQTRRARERDALIVPFTRDQLLARMAYWGNRCYVCGEPWEAFDHVKPLSKGGAHCLANFRPICETHNSSKKNRWHGVDWVRSFTGSGSVLRLAVA